MAEPKLNLDQLNPKQEDDRAKYRHSIAGNYPFVPKILGLGVEYEIEPISEKDDKSFEDSSSGKMCSFIFHF